MGSACGQLSLRQENDLVVFEATLAVDFGTDPATLLWPPGTVSTERRWLSTGWATTLCFAPPPPARPARVPPADLSCWKVHYTPPPKRDGVYRGGVVEGTSLFLTGHA